MIEKGPDLWAFAKLSLDHTWWVFLDLHKLQNIITSFLFDNYMVNIMLIRTYL